MFLQPEDFAYLGGSGKTNSCLSHDGLLHPEVTVVV